MPFTRLVRPVCLFIGLGLLSGAAALADQVTVFAAASLRNALQDISAEFQADTGHTLRLSYAGSSALARQIERGAPADVFISANVDWMDHIAKEGLIAPDTRFDLARNRLVLIAHGPADPVELTSDFDLAALIGDSRLAMGLVQAVPAGIYGKAALTALDQWNAVAPRVAQTDNVRAALALVATGAASYGIVYATDAVADPRVTVIAEFAPDTHPPIIYPAAAVIGRDAAAVRGVLAYLQSDAARQALERQGFQAP